jgi:hypothetical protein
VLILPLKVKHTLTGKWSQEREEPNAFFLFLGGVERYAVREKMSWVSGKVGHEKQRAERQVIARIPEILDPFVRLHPQGKG